MSIRLSKKQLIKMAERLDAIHCPCGNVYTYENIVYSVERINRQPGWRMECPELVRYDKLNKLMEDMERVRDESGADYIRCRQLVYSAGTYGNTGQLHAVHFVKNNELIKTLFIYY